MELFQEFETVVENINANTRIVEQIGEDDTWSKSKIYLQFIGKCPITGNMPSLISMTETESVFTLRHREVPDARMELPVYWGILKAVEDSQDTLVLQRAERMTASFIVCSRKALGKDGIPEGYIVISMRAENFEKCIHDKGNAKTDVAIMDPFWRTIYDNGNLQEEQIRHELMSGHKLLGVYRAGELLIQPLGESGLYTAWSCPSVFFNREVLKFHVQCVDRDADHQCHSVCFGGFPAG